MYHNFKPGHWESLSLVEQLANIGSEVYRAHKWKDKNPEYSHMAMCRALELFDLSKSDPKNRGSALGELCRARELWLDFFIGENQYNQTQKMWDNYFNAFAIYANNLKNGLQQ